MRARLAFLAAALALAACDRPAEVGATRPSTPAEEAALENIPATDGAGQPPIDVAPPYNLPTYAEPPRGAKIEQANATAENGAPGGLMVFTAETAPDQVAAHYRRRLEAAGFAAITDARANGARMLSAARPETGERIEITISAAPQGTRAQLAYRLPVSQR
ncbi:MAG: hypothetical protein AB7O04_12145 [Hyphomonadaceae bacterium]